MLSPPTLVVYLKDACGVVLRSKRASRAYDIALVCSCVC